VKRGRGAGTVGAGTGDTHIDDVDRSRVGDDPIETAGDLRPAPGVIGTENFDRPEPGTGGDADDTVEVVDGADRPGDVGAVTVVVGPTTGAGAVDTAGDVEIGVTGIDSGIKHRDIGVDETDPKKPTDTKDTPGKILIGIDPIDPGR
jgi:hypothetical protein